MKVGETITYRGYNITFDYPPISMRKFDYSFAAQDWDLDDPRCGHAGSVTECMELINEQILEHGDE